VETLAGIEWAPLVVIQFQRAFEHSHCAERPAIAAILYAVKSAE
jgi:hypothetical protein